MRPSSFRASWSRHSGDEGLSRLVAQRLWASGGGWGTVISGAECVGVVLRPQGTEAAGAKACQTRPLRRMQQTATKASRSRGERLSVEGWRGDGGRTPRRRPNRTPIRRPRRARPRPRFAEAAPNGQGGDLGPSLSAAVKSGSVSTCLQRTPKKEHPLHQHSSLVKYSHASRRGWNLGFAVSLERIPSV